MKRVMVVVDESFAREMVTLVLRIWGDEVDVVTTCKEAGNLKPPLAYSLFVIAATLPDGSGTDVCRYLRTFDHGTPIVVVSKEDKDVTLAIEAGAEASVIRGSSLVSLMIHALSLIPGS